VYDLKKKIISIIDVSKVVRFQNAEYHTFQLQSDKVLRVVIRNIQPTTDTLEISSALDKMGFTVKQVTNV